MSSLKHAVAYEQGHFRLPYESREQGWNIAEPFSSNLEDVAMHELYLWPSAEAIRAGAASITCSYNQVNNSHTCQNSYVLNHLIKNELGFEGLVVSDWTSVLLSSIGGKTSVQCSRIIYRFDDCQRGRVQLVWTGL